MTKRLSLVLAGLCACSAAGWAAERPAVIRGVRPLGMGDALAAAVDDQNVFFYNPAGTVLRTGSLTTLLEIPVTVGDDFKTAADFVNDNEEDLKNFDTLSPTRQAELVNKIDRDITTLDPYFAVGAPNITYLSGPMGNGVHWGLGLFSQAAGTFRINSGIVPTIDYNINVDAVPALNVAKRWERPFRLPGKLGVGVNLKAVIRSQAHDERVSFLQLEDYSSPEMQAGRGIGADLGFLYQPNSRWNIALVNQDLGGTSLTFDAVDAKKGFTAKAERTESIRPRWNAGVAWTPKRLGLPFFGVPTGDRLVLTADVKDFANAESKVLFDGGWIAETAGTHLHLGAEYRWWFLRFRGGFNQGYPTLGVGLDTWLMKLDYAFFSDELSRFAGSRKQTKHMLSLALRFGAGSTEARARLEKPAETPASAPAPVKAPAAPAEPPAEEESVQ
jgi:hypothetical protein